MLTFVLVFTLLFTVIVSANESGSSFETAIRLELYKDIIGHKQEYKSFDFPSGEQVIYFVITTESDGEHQVYVNGNHSYEVLDSNHNKVSSTYELEAGNTYYIKVTEASTGGSQLEIMVLDRTLNWSIDFGSFMKVAGIIGGGVLVIIIIVAVIIKIRTPRPVYTGSSYSSSSSSSSTSTMRGSDGRTYVKTTYTSGNAVKGPDGNWYLPK